MADENKISFKTADELTTFLMDLQEQIINVQETVDKMAPAEEAEATEETTEQEETDVVEKEPSEEELSEIDQLLQQS